MDIATARNGTTVSYCIPIGKKNMDRNTGILGSIKIERPKACWKGPVAVSRKNVDDFDTDENSNSLSF